MIIEKIHLENFKSHQDTLVEFSTGVTTLMGPNGAGKSSIFEAVSFALFKQYTSKKIEQLIRTGAKKMAVEVTFTVGGRTYQVRRERSKTSRATLKIYEGNNFDAMVQGDTDVTKYIENLLEMDGELFLNAVYVRQGEIADLIDKTPAEKKQMIGRLLGIDSLEKAWKNMKFIIEKYEDQTLKLEGKLESFEDLGQEITTKQDVKTNLEDELNQVNNDLQETITECQMINEKKEIIEKKAFDHERISSQITSNQKMLLQLQETSENLDHELELINNTQKEIKEIEPTITALKPLKRLKEQINEIKQLQKEESTLLTELTRIKNFQNTITQTQEDHTEHAVLIEAVTQLENDRKAYEGSRALYEQAQNRKAHLEYDSKIALNVINNNLISFNEVLGVRFRTITEFENYLETILPTLEEQLTTTQTEINELNTHISNLKVKNQSLKKPIEELKAVKDSCPICKSTITPEKQSQLLGEYQAEVKENSLTIDSLFEKVGELTNTVLDLEAQKTKINSINLNTIKLHHKSIENSKEELTKIATDSEKLQQDIKELEIIETQIKEFKSQIETVKENSEKYRVAQESLKAMGDFQECQRKLDEVQGNLVIKNHSVQHFDGNIDQEIARLEILTDRYQLLQGQVSHKWSILQNIKKNKESKKIFESHQKEFQETLERINYSEEAHDRIKLEWELKNKEVNDLSGKKHSITGQLEQLTHSLKELHEKEESFQKLEKELKGIKDFVKLLKFIRDTYGKDGVQKQLRNISRPLIEEKTRDLFERFNFEYTDIQLDNEYNISIFGPAGESNLDMISGGEKIAVALALRLAITQVLSGNNLELIMLDEPTVHLDSYRRQELIDLLKRMSILPQMIIVTHDPDLEEAADNVLRLEKESGESSVAEVLE